ncbi:MAG: hypothetical protein U1E53_21105 [Dongiaceae bacterium]
MTLQDAIGARPTRGVGAWVAANRQTIVIALALGLASQASAWAAGAAYFWWVGQPLQLTAFCKWDCNWYASIVDGGYHLAPGGIAAGDAANWGFFPLLPLLARLVRAVTGLNAGASLLLTTGCLLPACIAAFLRLLKAYGIALDPWLAGSLVAFSPYAVYAHAGYSEALYFALTASALVALRRGGWMSAGLLGGGAAATRLVGLCVVLPMLTRLLRPGGGPARPPGPVSGPLVPWVAIGLVPLGTALFCWHLYLRTGDLLAYQSMVVGSWDRIPDNPFVLLWACLVVPGWFRFFGLTILAGLAAAFYLCRRGEVGLALMLAAAILMPLSGAISGMPRYVFWQPAFLLVLAILAQHRVARLVLLPVLWGASIAMNALWLSGNAALI